MHMRALYVYTGREKFGGFNTPVILAMQRFAVLDKQARAISGALKARARGGMQDILGHAGNFARHAVEAGEIVNVDDDQPLRRLQDIDTIEIEAEELPDAACDSQHLARHRNLRFLYNSVEWGAFHNSVHFLTRDIELDVIASVLDVVHRQIVRAFINL